MFTLLPHAEEIFQVDYQMSAGIRGVESLSLFPTAAKSFITRGRAFPLSSYLPSGCQCGLNQRRRQGSKARVLCQSGASRCRGKVPTHGETRLCFGYGSPQTQTILSSPHSNCLDRQALTTGNEQPESCWSIGTMSDRVEQV